MAGSVSEAKPAHKICTPPIRRLFIYYLLGHPSGELRLGDNFLGHWQEEESAFLFFSAAAPRQVENLVDAQPHLTLVDHYHMPYEQWQGGHVMPFTVGNITIRPPWVPAGPKAVGQMEIVLDPGVVFGNGRHTTTRDCLQAMQVLWALSRPAWVLDLGCGTGVLALTAAALGARRVLAVDLNRLAVQTARANVIRNALDECIITVHGRAEAHVGTPADLLMANIHFAIMQPLVTADGFGKHRYFILSGLLRSEARQIETLLTDRGARIMQSWSGDGIWTTYLGRN
jgi:ribosomal protein L11 methyltransferase